MLKVKKKTYVEKYKEVELGNPKGINSIPFDLEGTSTSRIVSPNIGNLIASNEVLVKEIPQPQSGKEVWSKSLVVVHGHNNNKENLIALQDSPSNHSLERN